jgi:hypothetical protein
MADTPALALLGGPRAWKMLAQLQTRFPNWEASESWEMKFSPKPPRRMLQQTNERTRAHQMNETRASFSLAARWIAFGALEFQIV